MDVQALSPVAVVTDSAAGIPMDMRAHYGIEVIPYWVRVGEQTYRDELDITPAELFKVLRAQPTAEAGTSIPTVAAFLDVYQRVASWAKAVVSVHVAGKQSGTCNAAQLAAEASPIPVAVVDTGTTAMAEGWVAIEAARAAQQGGGFADVVRRAQEVVSRVQLTALLEGVTYAVRGGRLASAARLVGNLLNIQPLIRVRNNSLSIWGQVRSRSKGINQLTSRLVEEIGTAPTHLVVHYTEDEAESRSVLETLKQRLNCVESYLTYVPVALGVHAGPGAIGIATYVES